MFFICLFKFLKICNRISNVNNENVNTAIFSNPPSTNIIANFARESLSFKQSTLAIEKFRESLKLPERPFESNNYFNNKMIALLTEKHYRICFGTKFFSANV